MDSKKIEKLSKRLLIGLWVFIAISMMTNCSGEHHGVLYYHDNDKTLNSTISSLFIFLPIIIVNILIWGSNSSHWFFKLIYSLIASPLLSFIFMLISTQTTKTFINMYVTKNYPYDEKVSDTLVVSNKSISQNHGTHYKLKLKLNKDNYMNYGVNEREYKQTNIHDSIPVQYYKNKNGSIYR